MHDVILKKLQRSIRRNPNKGKKTQPNTTTTNGSITDVNTDTDDLVAANDNKINEEKSLEAPTTASADKVVDIEPNNEHLGNQLGSGFRLIYVDPWRCILVDELP